MSAQIHLDNQAGKSAAAPEVADVFELKGLSEKERQKLQYLDKDNDGKIDPSELSRHMDDHAREKEMKLLFKNLVYALIILCFVLLGCLTYMTYAGDFLINICNQH
jgi:hypothetical protein